MSEEDKAKLLAKHEALGPLLNRLAHCQNALNIAGAGWKWDNPLGAYSLSLTKTGGLDMLNVYRQPCYIAGGKSLSLMQKAKCLKDMEGAYPSLPPKSVRTAVSAFNKAVFSIRMLLAAEGKPLWKAVGEAVKWFGDNGKEVKLSVKLNGIELNVDVTGRHSNLGRRRFLPFSAPPLIPCLPCAKAGAEGIRQGQDGRGEGCGR